MNFSQAIEAVSKIYVPGVVQFYEKQDPDHWQQAHDELEAAMLLFTGSYPDIESKIDNAASKFVTRITELVDRYKTLHGYTKKGGLSFADSAMRIGINSKDPEQADARMSLQDKRCAVCITPNDLRVVTKKGIGTPGLYCRKCVP